MGTIENAGGRRATTESLEQANCLFYLRFVITIMFNPRGIISYQNILMVDESFSPAIFPPDIGG